MFVLELNDESLKGDAAANEVARVLRAIADDFEHGKIYACAGGVAVLSRTEVASYMKGGG